MVATPQRQGGGEGGACDVADDDPARPMPIGLDFPLPRAVGRIVRDSAGRLDLEKLEPSPLYARIADIEQKNHGRQSRRSAIDPANPVAPLCS